MKIQQISVTGLFGIFDHTIKLNDDRITIIHGPNGFGKTAMLRMLNGFFNSQYRVFRTIPFNKFQVDLEGGYRIEISKNVETLEQGKQKENIDIYFYEEGVRIGSFKLKNSNVRIPIVMLDELVPGLSLMGSEMWRYNPTGELLSTNDLVERFEDVLPSDIRSQEDPKWLKNVKNNIHVRLIESQRLLNVFPSRSSRRQAGAEAMLPTVSAYSEEIASLIQSKLSEYGTTSQALDRTFPVRVVQQKIAHEVTDRELTQRLKNLEETRTRLIDVGLLDKDENSDFQIQYKFDENTKNILLMYVEDVEKKLSVFSEIADKIELFRRTVNSKFAYSYKEMSFSKEKGFIFNTRYPNSSNREMLSPTDLSSGEQHELVLLYELLFKVQPNSLVLIDEPELSLHVGWQVQFLKDLQEITELAKLDVLMATHSPDIIQDRWDLTVELKGPTR